MRLFFIFYLFILIQYFSVPFLFLLTFQLRFVITFISLIVFFKDLKKKHSYFRNFHSFFHSFFHFFCFILSFMKFFIHFLIQHFIQPFIQSVFHSTFLIFFHSFSFNLIPPFLYDNLFLPFHNYKDVSLFHYYFTDSRISLIVFFLYVFLSPSIIILSDLFCWFILPYSQYNICFIISTFFNHITTNNAKNLLKRKRLLSVKNIRKEKIYINKSEQ